MENTYWSNKGKYQKDYDRLLPLMPLMGPAETVAGELIRAVSKLGHELYNNGMGNNSSGAVNFLKHNNVINQETYDTIYPMTRGRLYNGNYDGDSFQKAVESAVDQTIEFLRKDPSLETVGLWCPEMFAYQDDDEELCEECGDELGYSPNGYSCQDCDEHNEQEDY
jgi:hypothetical protein|tara:strand:- start:120 stop:617 length:498 start_codon:yes stop_codon:yes gene_type:complete